MEKHEWDMPDKEGEFLYNIALSSKSKFIVETGTFRGASGVWFLKAIEAQGKGWFITYDITKPDGYTKQTEKQLRENHLIAVRRLEKVGSSFSTIVDSKIYAWSNKIDLLFIDGDHSYNSCLTDLQTFEPHVKKKGLILIHDYHGKGVPAAVRDYYVDKEYFGRKELTNDEFKNDLLIIWK